MGGKIRSNNNHTWTFLDFSFKPYKFDKSRGSSNNSRKQADITENAVIPKYLWIDLVQYITYKESFEGAWKEYFRFS